jgi:hypothetical protein
MNLKSVRNLLLPAVIAIIAGLSACSGNQDISPQADLQQAYLNAVKDAAIVEPGEIYKNLEPVVYYNDSIIWEGKPGESRALFVTWTSWDGYNGQAGEMINAARDIWVTLVPDIIDFCRVNKIEGDGATLRLEQLLGVPPAGGKKWFVEIWADPGDVFRPSPDPDISDCEAELDFPSWVNDEYKTWFNDLKSESYGEGGYPWTRLGYTYDWGNADSEVGLSEFVIRAGAAITIRSVASTADYIE